MLYSFISNSKSFHFGGGQLLAFPPVQTLGRRVRCPWWIDASVSEAARRSDIQHGVCKLRGDGNCSAARRYLFMRRTIAGRPSLLGHPAHMLALLTYLLIYACAFRTTRNRLRGITRICCFRCQTKLENCSLEVAPITLATF